jgi:hypothetical protein
MFFLVSKVKLAVQFVSTFMSEVFLEVIDERVEWYLHDSIKQNLSEVPLSFEEDINYQV